MPILVNEISEKYIQQLGKKKILKSVGFDDAVLSVKQAVEETAEIAKKEIESAVEPLRAKIAQKDEFIHQKEKENENLQNKLEKYKGVYKEAYKQAITPKIREQKNGIANILSGLIQHKKGLKKNNETVPVAKINEIKSEDAIKPETVKQAKAVKTVKIPKAQVSKDIIAQIERERINQKLDAVRMNKASVLIKTLLEDAPQDSFTYRGVQEHFKKTIDKYIRYVNNNISDRNEFEKDVFGRIRIGRNSERRIILKEKGIDYNNDFHPYTYEIFNEDGSSMEIYDGNADSYIMFRDTERKNLLKICYSDHYSIHIFDKNGRLMVSEGIKDGVVKFLSVNFNDVKPIAAIENDEPMNVYTQNLIQTAKTNCRSKKEGYRDTTDINYFNPKGKQTVQEYFVNKNLVFTYLFNPDSGRIEKLIHTGDFGIHAKFDEKMKCFVQYRAKGITGIDKRRKGGELKDFRIGFYKSTENEHFEAQDLYDKNYELDKDSFLQRPVYEKRNYGIASHPLTKAFTFYDLTKHSIKPWDFSILKPYIR